ncbi:MAG: ATP-binding protein [Treponema sp.]|nr:ATP-binding protein [Treponema sp.]
MKKKRTAIKYFGARLILGLFFISSLMVLLISFVVRNQMNASGEMLTEVTQSHLISAAQALAEYVSTEELDLYHTTEDTETQEFQELKHRLDTFAEDNNLLYAYYWRYYGNNQLQFIVDNDFDPEEEVGPWEITDIVEEFALSALAGNIGVTDLTSIVPTWDGLITAYAPVYDNDGNIYCIAGVDISQSYLFIQRRNAQRMTLLLLIAVPFSVISGILNMILYRRRAKQIEEANVNLANERDIIQTMKDNIDQGIFLMDLNLNILPQYSSTLISILSYHEPDLTGKNFIDILNASLDHEELQIMKDYFSMVFSKEKVAKLLDETNPIAEFEYKVDDNIKYLKTRFQLIEQAASEPVVIGLIQDISREKEIENELQVQKEAQEIEMKNMFDVIKIDPLVFQDFIESTDSNFNSINTLLKDQNVTEKQVVTRIFQYVHAIKSNAIILGLENLGNKLHILEEEIKTTSGKDTVTINDVLSLAVKIETFMQEMDSYIAIAKKINAYKVSNQLDTILINSLIKAVERLTSQLNKKASIKAGFIDLDILESKLRKPIRDILYQCVRNSIFHGIETIEERNKKNKNPSGLLTFAVKNVDGKAEVTFADDGSGFDWQKIKKKYQEKNPGKPVDKKVLLSSVFMPEFSTADETSTAAGRGVGLSLVRDIVKENKGTISVNSTEAGLMFKFTFPFLKKK